MNVFKLFSVGAATAIMLVATTAEADSLANAREMAWSWDPIDVRSEGESLVIILPQRRITDTIYLAIIRSGLCMGPHVDLPITGFSEVRILNEFGTQGFIYESGLEGCEDLDRLQILGATHAHSRSN